MRRMMVGFEFARQRIISIDERCHDGLERRRRIGQALKPRSMANTMAWARVHTPSLSKRFET